MSTEGNIYQRLTAARAVIGPVFKTRTADTGKYKYAYADLQTVMEAVEGPLAEQGLGLFQTVMTECVLTELRIVDGTESIKCAIPLPENLDPQKLGGAITYFRRYGIVTLLGLVTEEDDDAATTVRDTRAAAPAPVEPPTPVVPAGWSSYQDAVDAHNAVVPRIQALADGSWFVAHRDANGWLMPYDAFRDLEAKLAELEATAVESVAAAFPGATAT